MKWLRKEPQWRLHLFSLIDQSHQFIKGQPQGYAMKLINGKGLQALVGCVAVLLLGTGCSRLPPLEGRVESQALRDTGDTKLAQAIAPLTARHPGLTGIYELPDGRGAFASRALLINEAQRSLDVQYYIWHDDISGTMLLELLRRAADRGVRVRLLLDDNGVAGLDATLASLDASPNVEVRLYNPFVQRTFRPLGYLTDFRRLNHRMHNKSLTADGVVSIVGGRNVGDEYFGAAEEVNFSDLDLLAVGAVVGKVASIFDQYWNSASAYPLTLVVHEQPGDTAAMLSARVGELGGEPAVRAYAQALESTTVVRDLLAGSVPFEWTVAKVLADDPAKTLARHGPDKDLTLASRLVDVIGEPSAQFDVVSPYFVPGASGTEAFGELAKRGVKIRVLTNSLAATDVSAVHAGYAKRRSALLESGVRLYELKPDADAVTARITGSLLHRLGGSGASLHAKTFAVDGKRAFVGSFNFDPRSAALNTEMGFVVDSPALAQAIHQAFETKVPQLAYEARLGPDRRLEWVDRSQGSDQVLTTEPDSSLLKRGIVKVMSWLPIDWLL